MENPNVYVADQRQSRFQRSTSPPKTLTVNTAKVTFEESPVHQRKISRSSKSPEIFSRFNDFNNKLHELKSQNSQKEKTLMYNNFTGTGDNQESAGIVSEFDRMLKMQTRFGDTKPNEVPKDLES